MNTPFDLPTNPALWSATDCAQAAAEIAQLREQRKEHLTALDGLTSAIMRASRETDYEFASAYGRASELLTAARKEGWELDS